MKCTGPVCLADSNGANLPGQVPGEGKTEAHSPTKGGGCVARPRSRSNPGRRDAALVPRPGRNSAGTDGAGADEALPTGLVLGGGSVLRDASPSEHLRMTPRTNSGSAWTKASSPSSSETRVLTLRNPVPAAAEAARSVEGARVCAETPPLLHTVQTAAAGGLQGEAGAPHHPPAICQACFPPPQGTKCVTDGAGTSQRDLSASVLKKRLDDYTPKCWSWGPGEPASTVPFTLSLRRTHPKSSDPSTRLSP